MISKASHSPIRFAIVGFAGVIGATHIGALKRIPEAELVGLADIDAERGAKRAAASPDAAAASPSTSRPSI